MSTSFSSRRPRPLSNGLPLPPLIARAPLLSGKFSQFENLRFYGQSPAERVCGKLALTEKRDESMKKIHSILGGCLAAALTLASAFAPAMAAEKVQVSTPPLHSLVSILLENVDKPGLLFASQQEMQRPVIAPESYKRIKGASLVIWNGADYEKALSRVIKGERGLRSHSLTVSDTMPLFTLPDKTSADRPGQTRDMRFWLDPKLALMAIRRLAPALVKIYPDASSRILDNEIALKKRLKKLERSMRAMLKSVPGVPLHVPYSDVTYLAWRFNLKVSQCHEAAGLQDGFRTIAGMNRYFTMMHEIETALARCQGLDRKTS